MAKCHKILLKNILNSRDNVIPPLKGRGFNRIVKCEIYQKMFDLICAQYDGENALTIDSVQNLFREAFQSDLESFETAMFIISMAEVQKIFNKAKKEIKNYLTNDFKSKDMALLEKAEEAYKNAKCLESKALSSKLDDKNWIDDKEVPLSVLIRVTKKLLSDMRDGNDNPVLYADTPRSKLSGVLVAFVDPMRNIQRTTKNISIR